MSVRYVTRAIDELSVTGNDKLVLIALADHADDEGYCFPGQERLATRLGISDRTVRRVMVRLEEMELIARERRYREVDGARKTDGYHLYPEALPDTLPGAPTGQNEPAYRTTVAATKEPSVRTTSRKKKAETELPKDWQPTAEHMARAKASSLDLAKQAELFRLHAETHGRVAASWNAAFTTWLIKATDQPRPTIPQPARWAPQLNTERPRPIYDPRDPNSPKPYAGEY